ncbi:hypothetical protein R6Q59_016499 [Mikania micrantha]
MLLKVKSWRKLKALVRYNKIGTRSGFSRFKPCYIITRILGIAEKTIQGVVFNEVLTAAARDIVTKDILRMASGWPMQGRSLKLLLVLLHFFRFFFFLCMNLI